MLQTQEIVRSIGLYVQVSAAIMMWAHLEDEEPLEDLQLLADLPHWTNRLNNLQIKTMLVRGRCLQGLQGLSRRWTVELCLASTMSHLQHINRIDLRGGNKAIAVQVLQIYDTLPLAVQDLNLKRWATYKMRGQ